MDKVNIYIYSGVKDLRVIKNKYGAVGFILETEKNGTTITYTETFILQESTKQHSNLCVLHEALGHIKKPCALSIYTESVNLPTAFKTWINDWEQSGWKTKKGDDVKYKEKYKEISSILSKHEVSWHTEKHVYSSWLQDEVENKQSCLGGVWSREEGENQNEEKNDTQSK